MCLKRATGSIARDMIQAEAVDLLVSDINMPGLDGLGLIEYAVEHQRVRLGIVVLTNRWDHGDISDRLAAWGVHVMPKPFSPTRLAEVVDKLTAAAPSSSAGDTPGGAPA
jgi:CheY-like chemotaxis protein